MEFLKSRSFGNRLSDTFAFLQQNFKPLFGGLLTITLPVFFIYIIVVFFYYSNPVSALGARYVVSEGLQNQTMDFIWIVPFYLLMALINALILTITYSYIKLYNDDKKQIITPTMLWQLTKKYFGRIIGAYSLFFFAWILTISLFVLIIGSLFGSSGMPIIVSFVFLGLLFFYYGIRLNFFPVFIIFEEKKMIDSFTESYKFTKGFFLKTLGFVLALLLIVGIMAQIVQLPSTIIMQVRMLVGLDAFWNNLGIVWASIGSSFALLLYTVIHTGHAIFYFSEIEERYGIMANQEIDEIGKIKE
jgi:hypothetical protein